MSFMKDVLKFVPVLGWTHIFQGTIMLKRNWNRDRITLEKRMAQLNNSELEGYVYLPWTTLILHM